MVIGKERARELETESCSDNRLSPFRRNESKGHFRKLCLLKCGNRRVKVNSKYGNF